ncbi:hypothetical protein GCM10009850_102730 [Nonomuraea monospora]|uniref:Uncharacterized protein n=1 Tax=Nonomuraea monospora TaxID=568818 RepID=A0ABP5PT40_9ACTN
MRQGDRAGAAQEVIGQAAARLPPQRQRLGGRFERSVTPVWGLVGGPPAERPTAAVEEDRAQGLIID